MRSERWRRWNSRFEAVNWPPGALIQKVIEIEQGLLVLVKQLPLRGNAPRIFLLQSFKIGGFLMLKIRGKVRCIRIDNYISSYTVPE
jgi:hypothetical protein